MNVTILLFATLRDTAGQRQISVETPEPTTVADVLGAISAAYPALTPSLGVSIVAVNRAFAEPDTPVTPGDEVALFPPVSGG